MPQDTFSDAFGDLNAALASAGDAVLILPLAALVEDPTNPRSRFDPTELDALAQTIRDKGVLQPIIVRPPGPDGTHMIRFGARRFRAAQLAGLSEIRAIVQVGDMDDAEGLIEQLVENEQREGLTTAELAAAVDRLLDLKLSQSDIARRLGRSRDQVAMLAAVRAMPDALKALAPQLGLRTLFELHQAWKADADRTRVWLAGREPKSITQAAARALAGRPVPNRHLVRDPSDGSVQDVEAPRPAAASAAPRRRTSAERASRPEAPPHGTAVFEVQAQGVKGTLVLDNVRSPSAGVLVRLADGSVQPVPAANIKIVRVRPG